MSEARTVHGKPTKFMCLLLKMLQIQPDLEIVVGIRDQ